MKIEVPFYKQEKDHTCGPAALQMVLDFWGKYKSEASIAREVNADKEIGTSHGDLIATARKYGFTVRSVVNASLNELKKSINDGLPVIVNYVEPTYNVGHYSVVVGYGKNHIIMNDPSNGKDFKILKKEFLDRWHEGFGSKEKWMMIVSNKGV